jgi:hypothetical protein
VKNDLFTDAEGPHSERILMATTLLGVRKIVTIIEILRTQ